MYEDGSWELVYCGYSTAGFIQPPISCGEFNGTTLYLNTYRGHALTVKQYQELKQQKTDPVDVITGAGFFSFGLGVVVACWLVAHAAGLVVQSVRSF